MRFRTADQVPNLDRGNRNCHGVLVDVGERASVLVLAGQHSGSERNLPMDGAAWLDNQVTAWATNAAAEGLRSRRTVVVDVELIVNRVLETRIIDNPNFAWDLTLSGSETGSSSGLSMARTGRFWTAYASSARRPQPPSPTKHIRIRTRARILKICHTRG